MTTNLDGQTESYPQTPLSSAMMSIHQVLLLDPNAQRRQCVAQALKPLALELRQATDFESALTELNGCPCEWLLISDEIPLEQFRELAAQAPRLTQGPAQVILFLAGTVESAAAGLEAGASDALLFDELEPDRLRLALRKAARTLLLARRATVLPPAALPSTPGQSPAFLSVLQAARKLAHSSAAVLIQGERGSGKRTLARSLHRQSDRAHGPLWELNCLTLSHDQTAPLLFGSETLTPSGHRVCRPGLLEMADGMGTVLIHGIHLLPESAQEKLVHFLQNRTFTRAGGKETLSSAARLLTTTSVCLRSGVENNTFREDLFLILNSLSLAMPPLRERGPDIVPLAESLLRESARGQVKKILALAPECRALLEKHPWPGNLSEFKETIRRAVSLCPDGAVLKTEHLFPEPPRLETSAPVSRNEGEDLATVEKLHILEVLKKCQNNRTHAARRLGISIRTLRNKLREYRLASDSAREAGFMREAA